MKKNLFLVCLFILILSSCHTPYLILNPSQTTGVDFTTGKWLLNELDCPKDSKEKLTSETIKSLKEQLHDRLFYINDVNGLLITRKIALNPNKATLKELKNGTGFDFFINISTKRNKNDIGIIGLYEDENSVGSNQSEVTLEVYDLNLHQIIYSQRIIGTDYSRKEKSVWESKKSDKLIDNITFHKSSNKLQFGSLKKILKDLKKKSILN